MRKLLAVLIVLAICLVGFGVYSGWSALTGPSPPVGSNEVDVNLATRTGKMTDDAETVKVKAAELPGNAADNTAEAANRPTD